MTERQVVRQAPAKVNAFLRILGRRDDGYHDVESLVIPLSLADTVAVQPAPSLAVDVRGQTAGAVEGMNLALVAALAIAEACEPSSGAKIDIEKRIPVAAGLGGGSADAAAALLALDELWGCGLGREELAEVGSLVGSDVPAMLAGRAVLVGGRGERVEPAAIAPTWWVLRPLGFATRSPDAYRWWDEDLAGTGPDPTDLISAARAGDVERLGPLLFDDLESPVAARHPEIVDAHQELLAAGALGVLMSGSGPTIAGLVRDRKHAESIERMIPGAIAASGSA